MFILKYTGDDTKLFSNGSVYVGRIAKSGDLMVSSNLNSWVTVDGRSMAYYRLRNKFEEVKVFYAENHKIAINYGRYFAKEDLSIELEEYDFNGAGWHFKVGQVYSSPFTFNRFLVTKLVQDVGDFKPNDLKIYYVEVDKDDYSKIIDDNEDYHRAWFVNGGVWDLEMDCELRERGEDICET